MSRAAPTSTRGPAPAAARGAAPWQLAHPLWLCAFRPFFALAAIAAWGSMAAWAGFLFLGWPLPAVPGGPFVWHVHELLVGFALAAVAGFALTGIPEFTDTPSFAARPVRVLVLLWLLARIAFWLSGWWPHAALALAGAPAHAQPVPPWDEVLAKARGQTVNWNAWAGDEKTKSIETVKLETLREIEREFAHIWEEQP